MKNSPKYLPFQMAVAFKYSFLAFFLFLLAFPTQEVYAQKNKKKHKKSALKLAKEHLSFEEYEAAIPQIEELLKEDSRNAYYNFWMGKALYLTYRKNQALPFFEITGEVNADVDKEFHHYYGLALHYSLRFDHAITEYRKDLERYDPDSDEFRNVNNRISQCVYAKKLTRKKESELVKIKNLGDRINTEFSEHSPVISADKSVLIFTARRPDSRGADPDSYYYDEDIYVSHNEGGKWSEAENIGLPINSKGHDATISLTADGKKLYIYRHKRDGGLYVTDFDEAGKKWKEPKKVVKPLNTKYYEASICQSADSSMLFFTSDRPGGYGGLDIYMVKKEGDKWGKPENVGPMINTPFNEDAPFIHPDNRTLYYSSNGPNGMGGYDIFVTELDDNKENWLVPLNMGPPINTPDDEIYFVLSADGLDGYYTSGKEGGMGEKDIYEIKFPYFHYPKRQYVVEIVGIVQDANSLDTIPSVVRLIDVEDDEVIDSMVTNASLGRYSFAVEPERAYSLEVVANGYDAVNDSFTTPTLKGEDLFLEKNLFVKRIEIPVAKARSPQIQNIYFDFDKMDLREESKNELDVIAEVLVRNENLSLEIWAHTDWYGTHGYNVELSESRARAAANYLYSKGLDASRISKVWFSENDPLKDNDNDRGRQFNRRCEFRFLSGNGNSVLSSLPLRTGSEGPFVDHTKPKGLPGFDNRMVGPMGDKLVQSVAGSTPDNGADDNSTGFISYMEAASQEDETASNMEENRGADVIQGFDLRNIYFDFDKSNLRTHSQDELDKIVAVLSTSPGYELVIKGHTDSFGSDDYNQALSLRRCDATYAYLIRHGIAASRISFAGYSESI
ncbi:MAG TPA: hypothetical protein ENJ82_08180, partial [Bacteroidetes bacterium]|nr:hypothetical protein [Bacteroidota bacterium]